MIFEMESLESALVILEATPIQSADVITKTQAARAHHERSRGGHLLRR